MIGPRIPARIPAEDDAVRPSPAYDGALIAVLAGAIVEPSVKGTLSRINIRRCMGFKGYKLHILTKDLWRQLNAGDDVTGLKLQAEIASGPPPAGPGIDP